MGCGRKCVSAVLIGSLTTLTQAATYNVDTTNDVISAGGSLSLREAIIAANTNGGPDTINIPTGTYTLSLAGNLEDASATGDLDLTDTSGSTTISGAGKGTTFIDGGAIDRVLDVLAMAGGVDSIVADKVYVIRHGPQKEDPIDVKISIRNAKNDDKSNIRLASGDVVSVEQTPATLGLDVVQRFIRIGVSGSVPLF